MNRGWEFAIRTGVYIGGTAPLPLPAEIREIEKYSPVFALSIEGSVTKELNPRWGIESGLRLETKGMKTGARVKNYHMEMVADDGGRMEGMWTGHVKTNVSTYGLTLPVLAVYQIGERWQVKGGLYGTFIFDSDFSGSAHDGYLRSGDPTGEKVNVTEATYDFSNDLSKFGYGLQLGAEWKAFRHLALHAYLAWGLRDVFKKDFETITFSMYPIYLNLGFGYRF